MASTTTTIIATFRRKYPDCDTTTALEYLNKVLADLCRLLPLYRDTEDITLSANSTPPHSYLDYALDEDIARIYGAEYWESSSSRRTLRNVADSALFQREPLWQSQDAGIPTRWYLTSSNAGARRIGFLPATNTATSGTYPFIRLYVTRVKTLTAGQTVPHGISNDDVFVHGMAYRWAQDTRPDQAAELYAVYQEFLKREVSYNYNTAAFEPPAVRPNWVTTGRTTWPGK